MSGKRGLYNVCVFVAYALVSTAGCDFPQKPQSVIISQPTVFRPSKPSDITTLQEAMGTIVTICREELRLATAIPIELRLYKNTASFASYGQGWRTLPIDLDNYTAFTLNKAIHINLEKTGGEKWEKLISLLAHEYAHSVQESISNRHVGRWFTEGFATWVAAKVLDSLGWRSYDLALERARIELLRNYDSLKRLTELDWHWQAISEKPAGHIEPYVLAFFATARLIDRQGLPRTIEYMKSGDFQKSFHMAPQEYADDFAVHLSSLVPSKKTHSAVIGKPEWKIGDRWTYALKNPGDPPEATRTIARQEKFEGEMSYVVKTDKTEVFRSKDTLARLAILRNGQ